MTVIGRCIAPVGSVVCEAFPYGFVCWEAVPADWQRATAISRGISRLENHDVVMV